MQSENLAKIWDNVDKNSDGCWEWQGGITKYGYGTLKVANKSRQAHRMAWIEIYGEIPVGLKVCHACDNRACCRPSHLFLGTQMDNVKDMVTKGRQHRGENSGSAKLRELDVKDILTSTQKNVFLAKKYKVSYQTIWAIKKKLIWKHLV